MKEDRKVCYKDLSNPLKTFVVIGWAIFAFDILMFLIGFVLGFLGGI